MDKFDYVIERLVDGKADHAFVRSSLPADMDLFELYNLLAKRIASLFLQASMSFDDADAAINDLNTIWLDDVGKYGFPEPAYSVYLAFDAGEFSVDNKDPVELYTKPELRRILDVAK